MIVYYNQRMNESFHHSTFSIHMIDKSIPHQMSSTFNYNTGIQFSNK